ncbi:hypothetical protein J6590_008120 [Homalodisca vitripennis]|nr:hypothetical protein J6590_008120 [Homalodisca vitripennis]
MDTSWIDFKADLRDFPQTDHSRRRGKTAKQSHRAVNFSYRCFTYTLSNTDTLSTEVSQAKHNLKVDSEKEDRTLSLCTTDEECDEMRICVDHKCQDACPIICYGNVTCQIYKNIFCPCLSAFSPWFHGCVEQDLLAMNDFRVPRMVRSAVLFVNKYYRANYLKFGTNALGILYLL